MIDNYLSYINVSYLGNMNDNKFSHAISLIEIYVEDEMLR